MSSDPDKAFQEALADPHLRVRLFRYACSMCRSRSEAEDIVQEALAQAWTHADQLRARPRLAAWTCRIVRNVYLQARRSSRFAPNALVSPECLSASDHLLLSKSVPLADELVMDQRTMASIGHCLRHLPPHYGIVVRLRHFVQLSNQETARRLGLTPDVAKQRLRRAHVMIREMLEPRAGLPQQRRTA